jgi:membrane protein YqaA with SNARE-associated domain
MDAFVHFLISYGCYGMFVAAFLAASIFPFSSEVVMAALQTAGTSPLQLLIWGTLGNVLGSMFNYWIGRKAKLEWIEKYLHVKKKDIDRAVKFMNGRGAWMGFFAFLPVLGDGITVALGIMRANIFITTTSIFIGKLLRYIILIYGVSLFIN